MPRLRPRHRAPATRPARLKRWGAIGVVAVALLAIPSLVRTPGRLLAACAVWVSAAALFELLSMLGFVLVFALVFGARSGRRPGVGTGLRALGAITVLPAGNLIGPGVAARSADTEADSVRGLARSTVALTILTTGPGVLVLGLLSVSLWLGWPDGPHDALRTLPAAGGSLVLVVAVALIARGSRLTEREPHRSGLRRIAGEVRVLGLGAAEARRLLVDRDWRLAGALAYYLCDNAVLWAAFHAYGHAPAVSVVMMGYLVGSLGAVVPLPAGIGAVEGGLFGALVLYGAPAAPAAVAVLLYRGVSVALPVTFSALTWARAPARLLRARRARRLEASRVIDLNLSPDAARPANQVRGPNVEAQGAGS